MFLSACETHTLEGIESNVASAFLLMGLCNIGEMRLDGLDPNRHGLTLAHANRQ